MFIRIRIFLFIAIYDLLKVILYDTKGDIF